MAIDNFYVAPAGDISGGLSGLSQILQFSQEKREAAAKEEELRAEKAQMQTDLLDAWESQDANRMAEVSLKYPQVSAQASQALGLMQDFQKKEAMDFAIEALSNPEKAGELAQRRTQLLTMQERNPADTQRFLQQFQEDPEAALMGLEMNLAAISPEAYKAYKEGQGASTDEPAAMQTLRLRAEASGLVEGTPEYEEFMRTGGNRSGLASAVTRTYDNGTVLQTLPDGSTKVLGPDGTEVTGQARVDALRTARTEQVDWEAARAGATARAKGEEDRIQTTIDEGLDAAQGVATLHRALDLLNEVETGGFDAAAIKAKQWLGIESADEGELSSSLGKAVLSQLRATFGAAFTEREGSRLEGIEARMGANTETNKRLLQQTLSIVERASNRAIDAAYEIGDERTARDIEDLLDFRLTDTGGAQSSGIPSSFLENGGTEAEWALMPAEDKALFE
jgi:hypothetical protein